MMTLEELKHEAELHGYRLVKKKASMKKMPCVCGNKQIALVRDYKVFSAIQGESHEIPGWCCICPKCQKRSGYSRTQENAVWIWNYWRKMMKDN